MTRLQSRHALFLVLLSFTAAAHADSARNWLAKMESAAHTYDYDGVFVYQHGQRLESMRVMHSVQHGVVHERLVSLNGSAREVIRNDKGVRCYFPSANGGMLESRPLAAKAFPSIVPQRLSHIDQDYDLRLGGIERVAERDAQVIIVKPKDEFRYGYRFWADRSTGLLLKASLLGSNNKSVEKFMFTQIHPGAKINPEELKPEGGHAVVAPDPQAASSVPIKNADWTVGALPPGFVLYAQIEHHLRGRPDPVEHFVYSDGLAAVSVFIEKLRPNSHPLRGSAKPLGALHAFGKVVGDHEITVVGEVPAATVDMIGESVKPKDK